MAITIYTYRTAVGTDGTLWVTSGTYRLKTGANFDLWCKVVDTSTVSPSAPTASTTSGFFSVGTITTKSSSGDTWIGTIRLIGGTGTTNTNQTLSIKYGSTTYTCNVRVNGTANGFSTNPTLASNFTYDDSNHAPITAWGASKSANLHWAMSTSNVVPPDSGWANALSSFTSVIRNAGTYYLWYKMQSTSTTYNDVPPTVYGTSITCSKATLTCTGSSHTVTYGSAVPTLSITYSGWKGDDGTSDLTTVPTITTTYTSSSNVSGSPYPTTVSGGSAINYSFSYVNGSITVNKASSRLSLTPTSATVYTQKTYDVSTAVQAHDGTVTYAITASTTTGTSSITSAGVVTCGTMSTSNDTDQSITVTVSDPGDGNHNSGSKTFTITVQKYAVTLTWNNSTTSVTYGSTLSVAATATSNPTGGTVGTLSYSLSSTTYFTISSSTVTAVQYSGSTTTTVTCSHARTSTVKAGSTTRTLTCGKATLTCTGSSHTITYGDAKPTLSITYSGWKFSDSTSSLTTAPTVSTTYTQGSNKGSYATTVSGGSATNYTFSYVSGSITVNARTATLSWGTITWTYDGQSHSTTCTVSNVISGDTCTVTLTGNSVGPAVATATVTASSLSNSNYALPSSKTKTLTVSTRAVTITAADKSRVYGNSNPTFTASITSGSLVASGDLGTISASCTATVTSNVGTYTITPTYTSNTNYSVTAVNGTLTISKATLTCTGSSHSITYGAAVPTLSITYSGWKNSEGTSVLTTVPTVTTTYTQGSAVGSYPTTVSGGAATNYSFSYVNGTITVSKRSVTITAADKSKTYGDANPTFTASITSGSLYQSGDLGTISATCTATQGSVVGTYTITPSYTANTNYTVTSVNGTLTVGKRTVSITFGSTKSWTYDGSAHSVTITVGNLYSTDAIGYTVTGNSITNYGSSTVTVTGITGDKVANYQLPSSGLTTTISITKRAVTLTAANKSKTYGDANPTLTSSITSGSLVASGDLGTLGATTTATQSSAVGTYTITPTYTSNTNYNVTTANGTLTVNKRTVTITWGTISWVYDGSAHSANPTLGNIYGSDVVRYTITGNSITHKGTTTATITALDNSNYQLPSSGTSATLTITQATTVLTWSSYSASMRVGDTQTVSATTNFGTVAYSSSNTAVATMSGAVITGVSNGTSTITASVATNSYGDWTAASITFVLTVANGVKVYYNGSYVDAIPYVYYNGSWHKAIVYVYDGSSWKSC